MGFGVTLSGLMSWGKAEFLEPRPVILPILITIHFTVSS